jgi:hypothetical protein
MDEQDPKLEGQNMDEQTVETIAELAELMSQPGNEFKVALAANVITMKEAMQTPFVFVVAVNPLDGSFQYVTKSDRPHVSDSLMKHFGEIWNEKIVPEVREQQPRVVVDNRPLIVIPGKGGGR